MELKRKISIIDLYIVDAVKHNEVATFLWYEPVLPDDEPEDFNHAMADRHFQRRILAHIWSKWKDLRVEVLLDGIRVLAREK